MDTYLRTPEIAKLIRIELKEQFPTTKFSVKSKSYSGGSSIDVRWIDGPSVPEINKIIKKFESKGITTYKGKKVRFGVDYCFAKREYSTNTFTKLANDTAKKWGIKKRFKTIQEITSYNEFIGDYRFSDYVYQQFYKAKFKT